MKAKITISVVLAAALMYGCTKDFYESANDAPKLTTTANIDVVDTIKISEKSTQLSYIFDITGNDYNGNITSYLATTTGAKILQGENNINGQRQAVELSKEKYDFSRTFEIVPTQAGMHTIRVDVADQFSLGSSIEKYVYSFENMRPKANITIGVPTRTNIWGVHYPLDFSKSFDRDEKWGGGLDTMYIKVVYQWALDQGYTEEQAVWVEQYSVAGRGLSFDFGLWDDGTEYADNLYCWVKDNEGAVSDTVHFAIGHVE